MRTSNASLTCLSVSPGEEESNACAASCNMPQVVDITSAAGTPLPIASPTTRPSRSYTILTSIVDAPSGKTSYHLVPFSCYLILDVDTGVGEDGMLLSNLLLEAFATWLLAGNQTAIDEVGVEQLV